MALRALFRSTLAALAVGAAILAPATGARALGVLLEIDATVSNVSGGNWLGLAPAPVVGDPVHLSILFDDLQNSWVAPSTYVLRSEYVSDAVSLDILLGTHHITHASPRPGTIQLWDVLPGASASLGDHVDFTSIDQGFYEAVEVEGLTLPAGEFLFMQGLDIELRSDVQNALDGWELPADLDPAVFAAGFLQFSLDRVPLPDPAYLAVSAQVDSFSYTLVPEPGSGLLFALGLVWLGRRRGARSCTRRI